MASQQSKHGGAKRVAVWSGRGAPRRSHERIYHNPPPYLDHLEGEANRGREILFSIRHTTPLVKYHDQEKPHVLCLFAGQGRVSLGFGCPSWPPSCLLGHTDELRLGSSTDEDPKDSTQPAITYVRGYSGHPVSPYALEQCRTLMMHLPRKPVWPTESLLGGLADEE